MRDAVALRIAYRWWHVVLAGDQLELLLDPLLLRIVVVVRVLHVQLPLLIHLHLLHLLREHVDRRRLARRHVGTWPIAHVGHDHAAVGKLILALLRQGRAGTREALVVRAGAVLAVRPRVGVRAGHDHRRRPLNHRHGHNHIILDVVEFIVRERLVLAHEHGALAPAGGAAGGGLRGVGRTTQQRRGWTITAAGVNQAGRTPCCPFTLKPTTHPLGRR
mmetsp:Transcript_65145/g.178761  ORF Transcript_65145/g.178761 Transcript_65145/m.178761 type:complete len:218 (-) Transcript_65145:42-695(-)